MSQYVKYSFFRGDVFCFGCLSRSLC